MNESNQYLDYEGLSYYHNKLQQERAAKDALIAQALEALDEKTEIQIGGDTPTDEDIKIYIDESSDYAVVYTAEQTEQLINDAAAKIPKNVSELKNDSNYATTNEVDQRIKKLIGAAPEALDTLEEIADKLGDNDDAIASIVQTLGQKADKSYVDDLELGEINVQSDWNQTNTTEDDYIKNKPKLGALAAKDSLSASDVKALPDTTKYAGAATQGGSANSAVKLDTTTAGSAKQPVYFADGKPVAVTHTLEADVPANAVFTDTHHDGSVEASAGKALKKVAIASDGTWSKEELDLAKVAISGSYNDLSDKPSIADEQVQADWNETDTESKAFIQNKPTIPAAQVQSDWNVTDTNSKAFIANKPTITPAEVQIVKDSTETIDDDIKIVIEEDTDDLSTLVYTKAQTDDAIDTRIKQLIGAAPAALDTLEEIADKLNDDDSAIAAITNTVSQKANKADLATVTTTGSYNDLTDKPSIPSKTSDLTNDSDFATKTEANEVQVNGDPASGVKLLVDETEDASVEVYSKAQVDAMIDKIYEILRNNGLTV